MENKMTNKDSKFRTIARRFVILKGINGAMTSWTNAVYAFFILSKGYDLLHFTIVNAVFMAVSAGFDPLSGKLADKYGQRPIFIVSNLFWGAAMLIYFNSEVYWQFILAEIFAGIGFALASEALESWLENWSKHYRVGTKKIRANAEWARVFSGMPAAIIGGLVGAAIGFNWAFLLSAVNAFAAFAISWILLRKLGEADYSEEPEYLEVHWKSSFRNEYLRFSIIFTFVAYFCFQPLNMFWTEIMRIASGGEVWWQGLVWIPISLAFSFGAWLTGKPEKVGYRHFALLTASIAVFISLAVAFSSSSILLLVTFFAMSEIPRGAVRNLLFTFTNEHISSKSRSLLNSVRSSVSTFAAMLGLISFGVLTTVISPSQTWLVSGLLLIIFSGWVVATKRPQI